MWKSIVHIDGKCSNRNHQFSCDLLVIGCAFITDSIDLFGRSYAKERENKNSLENIIYNMSLSSFFFFFFFCNRNIGLKAN